MLHIPLSEESRRKEFDTIKHLALRNGYNDSSINKILHKETNKMHPLYMKPKSDNNKTWIAIKIKL